MTSVGKGSKVDLSTFKKWGKDGVIVKTGSESCPNILGPGYSNGLLDLTFTWSFIL